MTRFGWSYPPGAANDPSAPYNMEEPPEEWTEEYGVAWCFDCRRTIGPSRLENVGYDLAFNHPECETKLIDKWEERHTREGAD